MDRDRNYISQDMSVRWLRHLPHCLSCLAHDNSYLFPAWFDISRKDVEKLIARFQQHYPADLQQPLFFPNGDENLSLRLPRTQDVNQEHAGDLDLTTMMIEFNICTFWPEEHSGADSDWEQHRFGLDSPEGWAQMLNVFPPEDQEDTLRRRVHPEIPAQNPGQHPPAPAGGPRVPGCPPDHP